MDVKTGVYICSGCSINDLVDLDALQKVATNEVKAVHCAVDPLVCGGDCCKQIRADIAEKELDRIIISACSGRYFADRFNFGDGVLVDRLPLREFVAWTQKPDGDEEEEEVQMLAEDYLRMSGAKMKAGEPPKPYTDEVNRDLLVIGGGVAGMSAAQAATDAGYKVTLVEKESQLGGHAGGYKWVFPTETPFEKPIPSPTGAMIKAVSDHPNIAVHTSSQVTKTVGQPGQFDVTIKNEKGEETVRVGAIVQASGHRMYDPKKLGDMYGYGWQKNVISSSDFEQMVSNGGIKRPSDGKPPKSVAIVHCAGSRDKEHLPYCSAVCCRTALKQALYVQDEIPDANVYLLYKDIRSPGMYEQFYAAVQQTEGVFLIKGEVTKVDQVESDGTRVHLEETLLGEPVDVEADMVVLATGMVPTTQVESNEPVVAEEGGTEKERTTTEEKKDAASAEPGAKILNLTYRQGTDLPTLKYGFPDSHFICFPYETRRTGIYAAGTVRAPMDIPTARTDGLGAALKAIQAVENVALGSAVHPRAGDVSYPEFFLQRCTQCKRCTEECPFGSLDEDEKGTPLPNLMRCRRCGICMGACPERIVSFKNYSPNMVSQMIKAIDMPDEEDDKPRIVAFMCENDAIPALDIAANYRHKLDPIIRIIPVRCIGSVNTIWIADALSNGFDGIMLLGCKHGDDYQCHFIQGSELANKRMENVQEKLKQLVLEPERVKIDMVELSDWQRIPQMFSEFAEEIREIGMNPYKGF